MLKVAWNKHCFTNSLCKNLRVDLIQLLKDFRNHCLICWLSDGKSTDIRFDRYGKESSKTSSGLVSGVTRSVTSQEIQCHVGVVEL